MASVFFFQAEDGIRDVAVTGVQTCALPISQFSGGSGPISVDTSVYALRYKRCAFVAHCENACLGNQAGLPFYLMWGGFLHTPGWWYTCFKLQCPYYGTLAVNTKSGGVFSYYPVTVKTEGVR